MQTMDRKQERDCDSLCHTSDLTSVVTLLPASKCGQWACRYKDMEE